MVQSQIYSLLTETEGVFCSKKGGEKLLVILNGFGGRHDQLKSP